MEKITPLNLIKQVNPESAKLQPGFYKQIVFEALTVISALVLGYLYNGFLIGTFDFAFLIAGLTLFTILSTLHSFFTRDFMRRTAVTVLCVLGITLFFLEPSLQIFFSAVAVMLVLMSWGGIALRMELDNSLNIKFFKATKKFLSKLTTAIIIAFILLYVPQWSPDNIFVSRDNFKGFFSWTSGIVSGFYPEIRLDSTFSELAKSVATIQLKNDELFNGLSPSAKATIIQQTTEQVSASLSKGLEITIDPNAPVSDAFYDFIIKFLTDWQIRYGNYFIAGWGIAIFLMIRGLGTVFYLLAGFLSFVFYQILLASGVIHVQGETRTHEFLEW